jgi:hypothetical protein
MAKRVKNTVKFRDRRKIKGKAPKDETLKDKPHVEGKLDDAVTTRHRKQRMVAALKEHLGIVAYACESVGIGTTTHYRWLKEDANYAEKVLEAEDRMIGFTERKLFELVEARDREACKFVLDRRGRRQGWGQAPLELSSPQGAPLRVEHGVDPLFLEEEAPVSALVSIVAKLTGLGRK